MIRHIPFATLAGPENSPHPAFWGKAVVVLATYTPTEVGWKDRAAQEGILSISKSKPDPTNLQWAKSLLH